ncbi:hypothetical protein KC8_18340 [Sphingomonas sp. KC8]|nr:hypothetical protein KC8_18340 [Sphingomonas sp. KC8]
MQQAPSAGVGRWLLKQVRHGDEMGEIVYSETCTTSFPIAPREPILAMASPPLANG